VPGIGPVQQSSTTTTQSAVPTALTGGDWVVLWVGVAAAVLGIVAAVIAFMSWRAAAASATEAKRSADAGVRSAAANEDMVEEAERLRREQAQPYVVVFTEQLPAMRYVFDLVIKNFGATAAHEVRLEITPQLTRSFDDDRGMREVWLPAEIPVLVPQQEWRTRWDTGNWRRHAGLPDRHDAVVTFTDSHGRGPDGTPGRFTYNFVLDWAAYWGQMGMGEPDIARSIQDGLKKIGDKIDDLGRRETHPDVPEDEEPPGGDG
jgi:hypothetical protein